MPSAVPHPSPASRFRAILAALCDRAAAEGHRRGVAGPLLILIWTRLRRLADRLATALDGPRHPPRARHPATASRPAPLRPAPARPHPLPRRFGWLGPLIPGAAGAAGQLRHLLNDPEIAALAAASPAAGRALRPLCHALGLRPPPALRRPKRPDRAPDCATHRAPKSVLPPPRAAAPAPQSGPQAAARPAHHLPRPRDRRNGA